MNFLSVICLRMFFISLSFWGTLVWQALFCFIILMTLFVCLLAPVGCSGKPGVILSVVLLNVSLLSGCSEYFIFNFQKFIMCLNVVFLVFFLLGVHCLLDRFLAFITFVKFLAIISLNIASFTFSQLFWDTDDVCILIFLVLYSVCVPSPFGAPNVLDTVCWPFKFIHLICCSY